VASVIFAQRIGLMEAIHAWGWGLGWGWSDLINAQKLVIKISTFDLERKAQVPG